MTTVMHLVGEEECEMELCTSLHVRRSADPFAWLHESATWKDEQGRIIRIEDMESSHALNSLRMLERNAFKIARLYWLWVWTNPLIAPRGDHATADCERFEQESFDDPVGWLHEFPLAKALKARAGEPNRRSLLADFGGVR
jgi:hypothetical protein